MGQQELSNVLESLKFNQLRRDESAKRQIEQAKLDAEIEQHREILKQRKEEFGASHDLAIKAAALLKSHHDLGLLKEHQALTEKAAAGIPTVGKTNTNYTGGQDQLDSSFGGEQQAVPGPSPSPPEMAQFQMPGPQQFGPQEDLSPPQIAQQPITSNLATKAAGITNPDNTKNTYQSGIKDTDGNLLQSSWTGGPKELAQQQADLGDITNQSKFKEMLIKASEAADLEAQKVKGRLDVANANSRRAADIADKQIAARASEGALNRQNKLATAGSKASKPGLLDMPNGRDYISNTLTRALNGDISEEKFLSEAKAMGAKGSELLPLINEVSKQGGFLNVKQQDMLGNLQQITSVAPIMRELNGLLNGNALDKAANIGKIKQLQSALSAMQPRFAKVVEGLSGRLSNLQMTKAEDAWIPSLGKTLFQSAETRDDNARQVADIIEKAADANLFGGWSKERRDSTMHNKNMLQPLELLRHGVAKSKSGNLGNAPAGNNPPKKINFEDYK